MNAERAKRRALLLDGVLSGLSISESARKAGYPPNYIRSKSRKLWRAASREFYRQILTNQRDWIQFNILALTGVKGLTTAFQLLLGGNI